MNSRRSRLFTPSRLLRLWLILPISLAAATLVISDGRAETLDEHGSLRAAIEHLIRAHGDGYPGGPDYLRRLDAIERRVSKSSATGEIAKLRSEFESLRRESLLANPLLVSHPIVFVARQQYRRDHHNTGTMFVISEVNAASFRGGGAIKIIDFARGGKVETLLELREGVARDLDVDFDGGRILFSMRRNRGEDYHLFEIGSDGNGLRQLTFKPGVADIDPMYLPDGRIVFASTRDPKYCGCNQHIQANLFRMNGDGSNIRQIGRNNLFESRPSLMPDGRILYDRWEYVDRHFGPSFGLWTTLPDGRGHALFYGNNSWSPGAIFDARVVPGTQQVIATLGACHDRPWGSLAIIDRRRGLDGQEPLARTWPPRIGPYLTNRRQYNKGNEIRHPVVAQIDLFQNLPLKYEDPFPLDDHFFLCSRMTGEGERTGIYLLDLFGNEILLHAEDPATGRGCFDPMPLAPRRRPPVIPDRVDLARTTGTFYVADIYRGTRMEGVPRGTIKTIRVVEAPPKRYFTEPLWEMDTLQRPAMNYNCTNNKRILGEAPVEADGSAYFEVPADRFVFFQALDGNGQMVQSMRSGTSLQAGEHAGCIGCHDRRYDSVRAADELVTMAMRRPPNRLKLPHGPPRAFNYLTEIQPIFDKYCVSCHDYGKEAEKSLNLAGDLGLAFNTSYLELRGRSPRRWFPDPPGGEKQLIKAVSDGPPEVLPPYAWGSHRSRLVDVLRDDHYEVKLDRESLVRIITWIDINAPYYGSYTCNYPNNPFGRSPLNDRQLQRLTELTGVAVGSRKPGDPMTGTQINFTRPPLSPCLAAMKDKNDPRYREALSIIQSGKKKLYSTTRADMPDFKLLNPTDQRRQARYFESLEDEATSRKAILNRESRFEKNDQ